MIVRIKEQKQKSNIVDWSSVRGASLVAQLVKNLPAMGIDLDSIPGLGRSSGEGKGYSILQYSGLENSIDFGVTKSWTRLSNLTFIQ